MDENKPRGLAPHCCQLILQSRAFHVVILFLVIIDAVLASCHNMLNSYGDETSERFHNFLYAAQVK